MQKAKAIAYPSLLALLSAVVLALPADSRAMSITMTAFLEPGQEVTAPILGPYEDPKGWATMVLDTQTGDFNWDITFEALSGMPTGLHFHGPAGPGANAGVEINIGAISGLNSPSVGSAVLSQQQIDDLLNGLWYINLHTERNPAGEIRGQINPVPEPATIGLFACGLGLVGVLARRQKRAA